MRIVRRAGLSTLLLAALGCKESPASSDTANVQFEIAAPFCGGGPITFQLQIDQQLVGTEQLADKQHSSVYSTTPGQHVIGERLNGHAFDADTTVTLVAGQNFTKVVDFYCS